MEKLQWIDYTADEIIDDPTMFHEIEEELADIFIYSLNFADKLNINVTDAIRKKLKKNQEKYPVEKARGSAKKYTEL